MTVVSRNIVYNMAGRCWAAALGIALVPVYVHLLGVESYGLIGFFTVLVSLANFLDLGLSATVNRELARRVADGKPSPAARDLLRTLELPYWGIGLVLGSAVAALAPFVARRWFQAPTLDPARVSHSIAFMGVALAFQWPISFYGGGLAGLQRQFRWNAINAFAGTFRTVGAALVLWIFSPRIETFFLWQILGFALQTLLLAVALWQSLGGFASGASWRPELFRSIRRFAGGVTAISGIGLLISQIDKIVLSRAVSLREFGYYSLASVIASALYTLTTPVFDASFPEFSRLHALRDDAALEEAYKKTTQTLSALIVPVAAVLCCCALQVVFVWSGDRDIVEKTHILVPLLALGTAINGLLSAPYALQLAWGWTRLALITNLLALLTLVPLMVVAISRYGSVGAAALWPAVNVLYLAVVPQLMHRRIFPRAKASWYLRSVALPATVAVGVALLGKALLPVPRPGNRVALLGALLGLFIAVETATVLVLPVPRLSLARILSRRQRPESSNPAVRSTRRMGSP